jgi:hypothetical protein
MAGDTTTERKNVMFEIGKKYTVIFVGGLAMTAVMRVKATEMRNPSAGLFLMAKGKRNRGIQAKWFEERDHAERSIVLPGWDWQALDRNPPIIHGNALLNLYMPLGEAQNIMAKNLNQHTRKGIVLSVYADNQIPVFPAEAAAESHAVMQRIVEKLSTQAPA